jgi:hypothetical protein
LFSFTYSVALSAVKYFVKEDERVWNNMMFVSCYFKVQFVIREKTTACLTRVLYKTLVITVRFKWTEYSPVNRSLFFPNCCSKNESLINSRLNFVDASGHENNEEADLWSWRNKQINSVSYKTENFNVTLTILVLLSVLVFCYWLRMYRPKPKKRKLCKRLINFMQCRRMSTV